jgi:hypothetical protein
MERRQRWQILLADRVAEELARRREELAPELDRRLVHLEGCVAKLPREQRAVVEGYYYHRRGIEELAEESGRSVEAAYKALQRVRQIFASPAVVGPDQFGRWMHLAVVVDGIGKHVTHYVNGVAVSRHQLKLEPPFLIGEAELGNWNPGRASKTAPYFIRHFSGVMDEFALFDRALYEQEIAQLYSDGNPQNRPDPSRKKSESAKTSRSSPPPTPRRSSKDRTSIEI